MLHVSTIGDPKNIKSQTKISAPTLGIKPT